MGELITMHHGTSNTKVELDCNVIAERFYNSLSDGSAAISISALPSRCVCAAEPQHA